jgi:hypothetical protein
MYEVLFNDKSYERDFSQYGIMTREKQIEISDVDKNLCSVIKDGSIKQIFDLNSVIDSINETTFSLLISKKSKIKAVISITVYGAMWEMTYVCGTANEKGLGSKLLTKLIKITELYEKPITIYGVGIPAGARKVYLSKGFTPQFNDDGLQLIIQ